MGSGRGADSFGLPASLVRSEKASQDARRLRRNLVNLHRVPCPLKQISSLRLLDSSLETAPINCARNLIMTNEVPHDRSQSSLERKAEIRRSRQQRSLNRRRWR